MTIPLEQKFETLETQLGTQHTEIMNALDTIATALGAPPPGPTTTLADVVTALTQTNTTLDGISEDNSTFYAAMLDVAGLINTNTDIIITNNSLNAQKMIAAILSTACACPTDAPLLAPPTDVTPTSLADEAKCRRIQFYLSVFGDWLTKIANYGSATGFVTGAAIDVLLTNAITAAGIVATGAEVGAVGGPPGIVIGAVLSLIVLAISVYGGSVLVDYANQFNAPTMQHALLDAMFAATNADEGYTAFKTTILANMDAIPAQIIYTLWWSAWSNDIYSGVPTVDDSAFDGSICAPDDANCFVVTSASFASAYQYIYFGSDSDFTAYADTIAGDGLGLNANYQYSAEWVSGSTTLRWEEYDNGGSWHSYTPVTSTSGPVETEIINGRVYLASTENEPFTARVCILTPL